MTTKRLRNILIVGLTIALLFLFCFSYSFEEKSFIIDKQLPNSIRIEIIKSLLQLLVVIIIGGIITALFKSTEVNRELSRLKAETWKEYLKKIGKNYQDVKLARRSLTAGGLTNKNDNKTSQLTPSQIELYIEQMKIINRSQIELEALKIESKYFPEYLSLTGISEELFSAEDYLRQILKEYEATLPTLNANKSVEFSSLEKLNEFTTSTSETFVFVKTNIDKQFRFTTHFGKPFDEIQKTFKKAFD